MSANEEIPIPHDPDQPTNGHQVNSPAPVQTLSEYTAPAPGLPLPSSNGAVNTLADTIPLPDETGVSDPGQAGTGGTGVSLQTPPRDAVAADTTGDQPVPPVPACPRPSQTPETTEKQQLATDYDPKDTPPPAGDSPDLWHMTVLTEGNATEASALVRLTDRHAARLVVALPAPGGEKDEGADIYAVNGTGVLSRDAAVGLLLETGRHFFGETMGREIVKVVRDQLRWMSRAGSLGRLEVLTPGLLSLLDMDGTLPAGLIVKTKTDIDADLSAVGTPLGVLDLRTGAVLSPEDGRDRFLSASIPDTFNPEARHYVADLIFPPLNRLEAGSIEEHRARILAVAFLHPPRREFVWECCARGSGKTTFVGALQTGFGDQYVDTLRVEAIQADDMGGGPTHHDGDLRKYGKPMRILFPTEFHGTPDTDKLKRVSGGDRVAFRRIRQEDETVDPTAHTWFQGNTREGEKAPKTGITGTDEDSMAVRDRLRILDRKRIPKEKQVPEFVDLGKKTTDDAKTFRQAVVARIVEYCQLFGDAGFPENLPSLEAVLEAQVESEKPAWQREWMPTALVETIAGPGVATEDVYKDYQAWHASAGKGKTVYSGDIIPAVANHYGVQAVRDPRTFVPRLTRFPGYALA